MKIQDFQDNVTCGGFDNIFANIYKPQDIESQKSRYMSAVEKFTALYPIPFPKGQLRIWSHLPLQL